MDGQVAVTSAAIKGDKTMAHPMGLRLGKAIVSKDLTVVPGEVFMGENRYGAPVFSRVDFHKHKGEDRFHQIPIGVRRRDGDVRRLSVTSDDFINLNLDK